MTTTARNAVIQSQDFLRESATAYVTVDVSAADFEPANPFKGVFIGTAGDLEITGLNGHSVVIPDVPAGVWPFAGMAILNASTTAEGIVAIY